MQDAGRLDTFDHRKVLAGSVGPVDPNSVLQRTFDDPWHGEWIPAGASGQAPPYNPGLAWGAPDDAGLSASGMGIVNCCIASSGWNPVCLDAAWCSRLRLMALGM